MDAERMEEQRHFDDCRELILKNTAGYEAEFEERHKKTQELFRMMQGGDVELYNQMMTSKSLEDHAAGQLKKTAPRMRILILAGSIIWIMRPKAGKRFISEKTVFFATRPTL